MAKLTGVFESINGDFIEHGGIGFHASDADVKLGDIVRCNNRRYGVIIRYGEYYQITEEADGAVAFLDEEDDATEIGKRSSVEFDYFVDESHFTVFRRVEAPPSTTVLIEQKRCELATLEAQLTEESTLKVGDYARVIVGHGGDFAAGDIVKIAEVDEEDEELPYKAVIIGHEFCESWIESAERLTPAEARAALIAQVNALFNGGDAE